MSPMDEPRIAQPDDEGVDADDLVGDITDDDQIDQMRFRAVDDGLGLSDDEEE